MNREIKGKNTQYEDQNLEKSDLEDYIKKYGKEFGIV